jgi:hypothetical protein
MKFWFQPYIEHPNLTLYVARASILVKSSSVNFGEVKFWNPRWSRSRVGHGLLLGVDILAPPP